MESENEVEDVGHTPHDYWRILVNRRAIILQSFLVIAVAGTVVTFVARPVYQGRARLLVEAQTTNINTVDASNPLSEILTLSQAQSVATQVEVLQSQPLIDGVKHAVGPVDLSVAEVNDTNIIEVVAEAHQPYMAADAANLLLRNYIDQDVDQNLQEIRAAKEFVQTQEIAAHERLIQSGNDLVAFKQKNKIIDVTQDQAALVAHIADLTQQVQKDQLDLSSLNDEIKTNRHFLALETASVTAKTQTTNPNLGTLHTQIAQLQIDRASMTQKGGFTSSAPQVMAVDAKMAELKKQLHNEPAMVTTSTSTPNPAIPELESKIQDLVSQSAAAATEVTVSQAALAQAKAEVPHFASWQVAYEQLVIANDSAQAADKMFTDKLADLSLREEAHHSSAYIIAPAQVPSIPVRPKRLESILFSCLMGLFLGVCVALLQEFLDDRINSIDEASRLLGHPSLGFVPLLTTGASKLLPDMRGIDPAAESYRALRTNIYFAAVDTPIRTLLVTSPSPGEGKSTTSVNLAFAMALDGRSVILVDADLRRPSVHKVLSLISTPGLTDVLLGHASLEDALQMSPNMPNLSILPCGSLPPNPSELINSRKFRNLVLSLSDRADVVIFDSPPVLVASDTPILSSQMDGTVVVVEAGNTKKAPAKRAVELLRQARAHILGIMYNKVNEQIAGSHYYYSYQYQAAYVALPDASAVSTNGVVGHLPGADEQSGTRIGTLRDKGEDV